MQEQNKLENWKESGQLINCLAIKWKKENLLKF